MPGFGGDAGGVEHVGQFFDAIVGKGGDGPVTCRTSVAETATRKFAGQASDPHRRSKNLPAMNRAGARKPESDACTA